MIRLTFLSNTTSDETLSEFFSHSRSPIAAAIHASLFARLIVSGLIILIDRRGVPELLTFVLAVLMLRERVFPEEVGKRKSLSEPSRMGASRLELFLSLFVFFHLHFVKPALCNKLIFCVPPEGTHIFFLLFYFLDRH